MKKWIKKTCKKVAIKLALCLPILSLYSFKVEASPSPLIENTNKIEKNLKEKEAIELASDTYDKEIEEYLQLLETLEKTQNEYQQMQEKLLRIKAEKLNVSPYEDTLYATTKSIGDFVIRNSSSVPIYTSNSDLLAGKNFKTAYYGTKEICLIKSIIMARENLVIDVDNMEDYETLKESGFSVTGYTLVNQYSLQEDGTLDIEGKCEEEGIQFAFQEKEQKRTRIIKKEILPC